MADVATGARGVQGVVRRRKAFWRRRLLARHRECDSATHSQIYLRHVGASNQKQGTLQELAVASGVARQLNDSGFIIPLKVDDLPFADHNIQISCLIAIPFTNGWPEGLARLLKSLEEDAVPKPNASGAASIASWWNANRLNTHIVARKSETLWTNWFPLTQMPRQLFVWEVPLDATLPGSFPHPTHRQGDWLFSFANAEALMGKAQSPTGGRGHSILSYLTREPPNRTGLKRHEVTTAVKQLLRQAWEKLAVERKLPLYELSSAARPYGFPGAPYPAIPLPLLAWTAGRAGAMSAGIARRPARPARSTSGIGTSGWRRCQSCTRRRRWR